MRPGGSGKTGRSALPEGPSPIRNYTLLETGRIGKYNTIAQTNVVIGVIGFNGSHRPREYYGSAPIHLKSVSAGSEVVDNQCVGVARLYIHKPQKIILVRTQAARAMVNIGGRSV